MMTVRGQHPISRHVGTDPRDLEEDETFRGIGKKRRNPPENLLNYIHVAESHEMIFLVLGLDISVFSASS